MMTDYLKPRFTLPAGPRADVPWPFAERPKKWCEVCGHVVSMCACAGREDFDVQASSPFPPKEDA
jgi:hypothetical protein